ncbi:hypothetical protein AAFF_G00401780 [Aldrovandia affinis]|uniref:Uncharacterized protein n=1 Tax=Aldrovandia affinis TaxID=143900 RepID=A0AAD7VZ38_9TELE|nr:hypothetical protein AAFF_G00401780 [Aldrovandia affinis]
MVDAAEWRRQQEQDTDLRPVLQWVEVQQRPLVDEVAVLSKATKGLWAAFESLRLCDCVLQRAWKEPATGEEKWQVVVPKGLKEAPGVASRRRTPEPRAPDDGEAAGRELRGVPGGGGGRGGGAGG